jgi:multidrug efflux pump subunit AcrA (membrane-fusion protein)
MRRHQAEIELLQQQLTNLEIRSPIDGLVVAGDLEKAEGAPLEMGQTVFEIAPLDRMVAEIAIDESEIPYARPGMDVSIKLNAFPFRKWQGTVQSISPSTEIVKDDSVFIAEVEIVNAEMLLKPGMEGSAKIVADRAPLGWSLFHRPYESLRYWMIW